LSNFGSGIAKDHSDAPGLSVGVNEYAAFNPERPFQSMSKLLSVSSKFDRLGVPAAGESGRELIGGLQHPRIPSLSRKEHQWADSDKASVMFSSPALHVFDLPGEVKVLALHPLFPWSRLIFLRFTAFSKPE
jgi:hypothetical protein